MSAYVIIDCGYNCHAKCEMKVAPNCTKKKLVRSRGGARGTTYSDTTLSVGTGARSSKLSIAFDF